MNRYGWTAFLKRFVNAFGNGLLAEKLRRRAWRSRIVSGVRRLRVALSCPVERDKVLFAASAWTCTCNPKAVARELARRRPDVDIVWILGEQAFRACGGRPDTGRAVRCWTWDAYRELATAHVLVENAYLFVTRGAPPKRPGQFVMNTWHGSLGIKRLDAGNAVRNGSGAANAAVIDALLTNSDFEDGVFAECPLAPAPRVRTGHPRNDIFFLPESSRLAVRDRVRAALGVPQGAKLALFAPTFRDDRLAAGPGGCDFAAWRDALSQRFGGEWTVAMRLHPLDAKALAEGLLSFPDGVLDASGYEDMQELLVAADAGITDYSSWIYDFLLCGRPGFLFAPDRAEYDGYHGFYYPLEATPFPVAETNESLVRAILEFDAESFARKTGEFLSGKGCMDDGKASARAADIIEKWLKEEIP